MTRIVTGLEKAGLVKRAAVAGDRRLTRIEATTKGQRVLAAGRARRVHKLAESLQSFDAKALAELERGVQLFREVIVAMNAQ